MRKQQLSNEAFKRLREAGQAIAYPEIDRLIQRALERILREASPAVAWSGGKDSIVLEFISRMAGIKSGVLGITNLEYPAFETWLKAHLPAEYDVVNTGHDREWLLNRPEMLFPDANHASRWFTIVQRRAQLVFAEKRGLETILVGRRLEDGNVVGPGAVVMNRGLRFVSPLYDWTHEQIFAVIDRYHLPMPPIYEWVNGYVCGTHPWPARQHCKSYEQGWEEIYQIDRTIVERMARYYGKARECLCRHQAGDSTPERPEAPGEERPHTRGRADQGATAQP